jgi:hypothetical protein
MRSAFIEGFNDKLRDECLNKAVFGSPAGTPRAAEG